jgi:hypothetical protein
MTYTEKFTLAVESDRLGTHGDTARAIAHDAMHQALLTLPDGGVRACAAAADLDSAEPEALAEWSACERAADAAAYAGWAQRPQSGGLSYRAVER